MTLTPCLHAEGAKVTDYHCAARRKEQLKKAGQKSGWGGKAGMHDAAYLHCIDCERGIKATPKVTLRPRIERVKEKVCASCKELKSAKKFSKAKNGRLYKICKKCLGERIQKGRKNAEQARKPKTEQQMPKTEQQMPIDNLKIDFTKHPDVLSRVRKAAEDELRSPENQILWWLKTKEKEFEGPQ